MIPTNTYIISHHHHYREGLKHLLEIAIPSLSVKTSSSITDVFSNDDISFVIVEPLFEDTDREQRNIEMIKQLTENGIKTCLISDSLRDEQCLELLNFSIFGFLFKSMKTKDIILAIRRILNGAYFIPPRLGKLLLDEYQQGNIYRKEL